MKAIIRSVAVLMISFTTLATASSASGREATLYDMFSDRDSVRTYVHPVTVTGSAEEIDKDLLRRELVNAFRTRMTINFQVVEQPRNAEIEVKCELTDFFWEGSDTESRSGGVGRFLRGVLMRGERGRLEGVFTVRDLKGDEMIFRRTIKATMSGRELTREEAKENLTRRIVSIFFRQAFSRPVSIDRI